MLRADINQTLLRGGERLPRSLFDRTLRELSRALRLKRPVNVSVAFVGDRQMRKLNREYRRRDRITDVLSFCLSGKESSQSVGEVIICYPQAKRQAKQMGHSTRKEVAFLLTHGILHVFGFDHEKMADAKKMFTLQARILKKLGVSSHL